MRESVFTADSQLKQVSSCGCIKSKKARLNFPGISKQAFADLVKPLFWAAGEMSRLTWNSMVRTAWADGNEYHFGPDFAWQMFLAQERICEETGDVLVFNTTKLAENEGNRTASIDRTVWGGRHYEPDNVRWVHKDYNWMKGRFSSGKVSNIAHKIVTHQNRKLVAEFSANYPTTQFAGPTLLGRQPWPLYPSF